MVRATLAFALTLPCAGDVCAWHSEEEGRDAEVTSVKMDAEMHSMVKRLLGRKGGNLPSRHEMIKAGLQKVDPKDAAVKYIMHKICASVPLHALLGKTLEERIVAMHKDASDELAEVTKRD